METSDRRYQELMESMGMRQRGSDRAPSRAGAMTERRVGMDAIEPEASAGRTTRMHTLGVARQTVAKQIQYQHADLRTPLIGVAREVKDVLLVDPDPDGLSEVQAALQLVADVEACSDFRAARARLLAQPPDLLVTNLRLGAYNGLHLLHLAAGTRTRCIAYAIYDDLVLAREVQALGAFYERAKRLPLTLPSYVSATLPHHDRRDPTVLDRRLTSRGGRRCTDRPSNVWLLDSSNG